MSVDIAMNGSMPLPRSLYVHVPFCRHRCGYCNFTLVANRDQWIDRYIDAIESEINLLLRDVDSPNLELDTLFLGGGTPSHLSPAQLSRLMDNICSKFSLDANAEISLEANPSDIDAHKIALLVELGFTRISLGVQSFNNDKLKFLERDHSGALAQTAIKLCKDNFKSVSVDLIFGSPGEDIDAWQRDLDTLVKLNPDHVSTYGLTIEKGTAFWSRHEKNEFSTLGSDIEADLYALAIETLNSHGIEQYEISNFARAGHRCGHNEAYWKSESFWALGPGAASFVNGVRRINHQSVSHYLKKIESGVLPVASEESLGSLEFAKDHLVFGLRRLDGIDFVAFESATGMTAEDVAGDVLEKLIGFGMIERTQNTIRLTKRGVMLYDSVAVELQ